MSLWDDMSPKIPGFRLILLNIIGLYFKELDEHKDWLFANIRKLYSIFIFLKIHWKHFVFNLPSLPSLLSLFFSSLHPSSHTHMFFQELGHSVPLSCCFFIIHLVSVFFHVLGTFTFLKIERKTMLSVPINLYPERVTSYQDFKSASWFSDLLSVLINTEALHTQDTPCQLLNQLCAAFHFRNENLDYLFTTV